MIEGKKKYKCSNCGEIKISEKADISEPTMELFLKMVAGYKVADNHRNYDCDVHECYTSQEDEYEVKDGEAVLIGTKNFKVNELGVFEYIGVVITKQETEI